MPPTISELCTLLVFLLDVIPLVRQPAVNYFDVFICLRTNSRWYIMEASKRACICACMTCLAKYSFTCWLLYGYPCYCLPIYQYTKLIVCHFKLWWFSERNETSLSLSSWLAVVTLLGYDLFFIIENEGRIGLKQVLTL